jgi:Holliday junction resolvase RusA-like endonuclease
MRRIELVLHGEPMSKQSARFKIKRNRYGKIVYKNGSPMIESYQLPKYGIKEKEYRRQIKSQLPKDFELFTKRVHCMKFKVVHPVRVEDKSSKKKQAFLKDGGLIEKTTLPDLPDNLKKLAYDSMSKLVFKDDGMVSKEFETSKWYGLNPRIEIILEGE